MSRFLVTLLLTACACACSHEPVWPPTPASLMPGVDACVECRMIVSDTRFAVQRHNPGSPVEWFDDLGCLLTKYAADGTDPLGVFVHAFDTEAWVRGDLAHVVHQADVISPMGYGLCTYETLEESRDAARKHVDAEIVPLTELLRPGSPLPSRVAPNPISETSKRN